MRSIVRDKRGDFQSLIIMVVVIIGLALAAIIFSKVFLMTTDELKSTGILTDDGITSIEIVEDNTINLLDLAIFMTLIALILGLIISSIFINTHPATTVIFIIAIIVAVFVSGLLANIYGEVTGEPELVGTASQFTYTNLILGEHFPIIVLVVGMIVVIILFGKPRRVDTI